MSPEERSLAAEVAGHYHRTVVPAILGPFAIALVEAAPIKPGDKVLDLGCGTGAASRAAAAKAGASGSVIAIDLNPGMLDVARAQALPAGAPIEWREGNAMKLDIPAHAMNVVVCAQMLQFVPDRPAAVAHMRRVLVHGGTLALGLWSTLADNPYFEALIETIGEHFGEAVANSLRPAFSLPGADEIRFLLAGSGFRDIQVHLEQQILDLPPLQDFVPKHIAATGMATAFSAAPESHRARIVESIIHRLAPFGPTDRIAVPFQSHFVLATA